MRRVYWTLFIVLALVPLEFGFIGADPSALSFRLNRASEPYVETVTGWMVENTASKLAGSETVQPASPDQVRQYFVDAGRLAQLRGGAGSTESEARALRERLASEGPSVEAGIQRSVADAAYSAGLGFHPVGLEIFPPVFFRFQTPPNLLVVSPRDRIDRIATVLLDPGLSVQQQQQIESRASGPRLSVLVTQIGGLGVYPSMIPENADPRWTMQTVAHEWTHQFLTFRPLGWKYSLGDLDDPRMITVNETVAETVGTEIGNEVFAKYYPDQPSNLPPATSRRTDTFRSAMREIRTHVDALLEEGKVTEAETYMESQRQNLANQGYYIRKLNQAYFAFYGSYAEEPSASGKTGNEISSRVKALRQASGSLGEFLWKLSSAGSYQDFLKITGNG